MTTSSAINAAPCQWCGKLHGVQCPDVRAIEYYQNGAVKRVEFKTGADYPPVLTPWPPVFGEPQVTC